MRGRIRKTRFRGERTSGSLAEWSKALASGASPKGRGFESHSCHSFARVRCRFLITKVPKPPPSISHYSLVVERLLRKQKVAGSIPVVGFTFRDIRKCMELSAVMGCMSSVRQCSLAVEHPLSKREVVGSNPAIGFFLRNINLHR